jgi:hypothetical protein
MQLGFYGRVFVQGPTLFDAFMTHLREAKLYENWRKANPGESARFDGFVAAPPGTPAPSMLTAFGRALCAAVEMRNGG